MTGENCKVKDALVARMIALNGKLTALGPSSFRDDQARAEIQQERESLRAEITMHRKKGHDGKACPDTHEDWGKS
jgi:hypothetical protein